MRSVLDPVDRERILDRFRSLKPDAPARWGRMNAPRMLAHLSDQMRHALGDVPTAPIPGPLRLPILKHLIMFWAPWPKGRITGPPEAFVTVPTTWQADLATFEGLVARFAADERQTAPDHASFGSMTRQSWGYFCHRHFDYHLKQFGA
jgi:hypothetical protein